MTTERKDKIVMILQAHFEAFVQDALGDIEYYDGLAELEGWDDEVFNFIQSLTCSSVQFEYYE